MSTAIEMITVLAPHIIIIIIGVANKVITILAPHIIIIIIIGVLAPHIIIIIIIGVANKVITILAPHIIIIIGVANKVIHLVQKAPPTPNAGIVIVVVLPWYNQ